MIHAVADLAAVISKGDILHEIQCDLATYDRDYPRSAAAPSPISESMGDIFDDDDLDDNNEIDRLWANNVIVDGPTFSRLFETTVSKMDASLNENGQTHIISAAQGLRKLREFDGAMFESMITGWMMRMRRSSHCSSFFKTVSLLIASSSVEIIALARVALAADLMSSDSVCDFPSPITFLTANRVNSHHTSSNIGLLHTHLTLFSKIILSPRSFLSLYDCIFPELRVVYLTQCLASGSIHTHDKTVSFYSQRIYDHSWAISADVRTQHRS